MICDKLIKTFSHLNRKNRENFLEESNQGLIDLFFKAIEQETYPNCKNDVVVKNPFIWADNFIDKILTNQYEEHNIFFLLNEGDKEFMTDEVVDSIYLAAEEEYDQF
jgi:stalled ribosome rescue protein Dom34